MVADLVARFMSKRQGSTARSGMEAKAMKVFAAFARIGPPLTENAEPAFFRSGVLTLTVGKSAWLTELTFLKGEVMERMNAALGKPVVKDIRLRLGNLRRPPPPKVKPVRLSAAELERVEGWAQEISDPEVREAMMRAAAQSVARGPVQTPIASGPAGPRVPTPDPEPEPQLMRYGHGDKPRDRWKEKKKKKKLKD